MINQTVYQQMDFRGGDKFEGDYIAADLLDGSNRTLYLKKKEDVYVLSEEEMMYLLTDFRVFQDRLPGTDTDVVKRFLSEY